MANPSRRTLAVLALVTVSLACSGPVEMARALTQALEASRPVPSAAPIPVTGPAAAASKDAVALDEWYERNFVGGYRKVGRRNPKWDRQAEELIRLSAPGMLHGMHSTTSADLLARARALKSAGCDDPLIAFLAARADIEEDPESPRAVELFEQAIAGMHDTAYSRAVAFRVAIGLYSAYSSANEGTGKRAALDPVVMRWFLQSLDDGSYGPDDDVVLLRHLDDADFSWFFSRNRAAIVPALEAHAWVDPWLRLYLTGQKAIDDAWNSRGTDYEVTDEGWRGMGQSLGDARRALTASWEARKDRPEAAASMISVAMAASEGDTPRQWFDRAVTAQIDYPDAYSSIINALRRRWNGNPDALRAFARACADTRRFDTVVPFQAFKAIEQMEWDEQDEARPHDERTNEYLPYPLHLLPPSPYRDSATYDMVAAVLERYRREPAQVWDFNRYASLQAAVAYKAGRYADALRFLHDVGGKLHQKAEHAVREPMLAARIEASAAPEGDSIRRAEGLFEDEHASEALPLFEKARATAPVAARAYLDQRIAAATLERDLARGATVRFLPAPDLAGWTAQEGRWSVDKDGALVGASNIRGLFITSDARVGADFEIEGDIDIASTSNGQFQAAILFGELPTFWTYRWSSFRVKKTLREGEVAYFSKHFVAPVHRIKRAVPLHNHVLIQSWKGRLSAWVNGDEVVRDYAPEWSPPNTPHVQVGFGAYVDENEFSVRFADMKLRRLTAPPGSPKTSSR